MINKIYKSLSTKFVLITTLVAVVLSISAIYFLKINFSPDFVNTKRINVIGDNIQEKVSKVINDNKVDQVETVTNSGKQEYRIYIYDSNKANTVKEQLKTIEGAEVNSFDIIPQKNFTSRDVTMILLGLNVVTIVASWLIFKHKLSTTKLASVVFVNLGVFYVFTLILVALISLLSNFGWQVSEFTLSVVTALLLLVTLLQAFINYMVVSKIENLEITKISETYTNYFEDHLKELVLSLVIFTLFTIPFMVLYDFTIELALLVYGMWNFVKLEAVLLPHVLEFVDQVFSKKKNSKKNNKNERKK